MYALAHGGLRADPMAKRELWCCRNCVASCTSLRSVGKIELFASRRQRVCAVALIQSQGAWRSLSLGAQQRARRTRRRRLAPRPCPVDWCSG